MESSKKDPASSCSSLPPSAASKEHAEPDGAIAYRLRDRELLRKRKAETLEKDSVQWVPRAQKKQQQKRGRSAKRVRGHQPEVNPTLDAEPTTDPQPDPQKETEPVHSEPTLPEPAFQGQLPMVTIQKPLSGMQPEVVEEEPAGSSLDPAGEEEMVKPAEAEILEDLKTSLENDQQDNEFSTHALC